MRESNLLYTDVEDALREALRDLLTARCPAGAATALYDGDRSIVPLLWKSLAAELGLAALLVPESAGGAGATAREAAVVQEELGRFAAPAPFLTSALVATTVLNFSDADDLLSELASGERTAALVVPLSASVASFTPVVTATPRGTVTGQVTSVAGAVEADLLLVPVRVDEGIEVHAVDAAAVDATPVVSLDMGRQLADLTFDEAPTRVVLGAEAGGPAVLAGLQIGAAMLASEQVGIAQWCLDTTVDYLQQRRQFGRIVGGFQALKHRLADLYTDVEGARAAARYAAACAAENDPDLAVAASIAQAFCSQVAVKAAEECVQLHGGIGMTWEYPAHLYLKRAKADQIAFGTPSVHRTVLSELVRLPI
ncbi:acyl-CoA dehydrogenase [Rhodococcus sp. SC4]|uniref:acyl-CoA dehydrogenase family protein n=1 Tax=Rhodococcus opacus TaxID=37919 RepID=UPI00076A609B|nr:acyl-CoA dehydrogenase family protein [Rhodococcus opacus]KXF56491.1 acyl-CoA dehydrogenase [Rhodococcus sp. SC4]MDV7090327.1 acyl-CoA dehydrogenase family protein [Rhodococcus opacus]